MTARSIKNFNIFKINDEVAQTIWYGCNQEWYRTKWRRLTGCGPTAVTNIIYYLNYTRGDYPQDESPPTKSESLSLMEEIWEFVTPTLRGIPSTKLLYDDVMAYAKSKKINIKYDVIDIAGIKRPRPTFQQLLSFLDEALQSDIPVAFLNLNNGVEKQLDSWHWVTIVSLEYAEDGKTALIEILDEGLIKKIDLVQWFHTTTRGGGFVSFNLI